MKILRWQIDNFHRRAPLRSRGPNLTRHETALLFHVASDAPNQLVLQRMHEGAETGAELDEGLCDPFAHEFQHIVNDSTRTENKLTNTFNVFHTRFKCS